MVTSDKAYYWIQADVLKADKMDLRESQGWLNRGYEGSSWCSVGASPDIIPILPVPHSVWALLPVWWVWLQMRWWKIELYHDHGCTDCRAY